MTRTSRIPWAVWTLYAIAWSVALLTTYPLAAQGTVVPTDYAFSVGKTIHVSAYAVFAVLTSFLPLSPSNRRLMLLVVIAHAPLTEFIQQFVGRTCSLLDIGLDLSGVALGFLIAWKRWFAPLND